MISVGAEILLKLKLKTMVVPRPADGGEAHTVAWGGDPAANHAEEVIGKVVPSRRRPRRRLAVAVVRVGPPR